MTLNPNWIPMRWTCGPLGATRLAGKQTLPPEIKETFEAWADPKSLDMIQGSPVNCLIIPWAAGSGDDKAQQAAVHKLLSAGRERGLSFVGTVEGKQNIAGAVQSGAQAGLAALMVESLEGLPEDVPAILRTPRTGVPWESVTSNFSLTDNLWPRLGLDKPKEGDEASAGPTGVPWVNSNGWLSLLARELSRERGHKGTDLNEKSIAAKLARPKALWLEYDPPEASDLDHPANYALAIADACAYGSRWVISLDDHLRVGLTQKDPRARDTWEKIVLTLRFFKGKESWNSYEPQGDLAVVSDFRGDNEFMATEILNLLARRHLQYRVIERSLTRRPRFGGLKAILWVDSAEGDFVWKPRLRAFVEQGGLLIAPKLWWPLTSQPKPGGLLDHYQVYGFSKGRIAIPVESMSDPYEVAFDTHMLMSRRSDLVRVFNVSACNTLITADGQKRTRLVQIINYSSSGRSDPGSVWLRTTNRKAQLWIPGAIEPMPLSGVRSRGGWEFQLPFFSTYAALELSMRGVQSL